MGWTGQLTGDAGASSAVPREETGAFMTQIEGTSRRVGLQMAELIWKRKVMVGLQGGILPEEQ